MRCLAAVAKQANDWAAKEEGLWSWMRALALGIRTSQGAVDQQSDGQRPKDDAVPFRGAAECDDCFTDGQKPQQLGRRLSATRQNYQLRQLRLPPRPSRRASSRFTARRTLLSSTCTSAPSYSNTVKLMIPAQHRLRPRPNR